MLKRIQQYFDQRTVRQAVGSCDETGMIRAVQTGNYALVQLMLELGITPDATSEVGEPATHIASESGQVKMLRLLVEKGANIEATDTRARTALMRAIEADHFLLFEYLLTCGAKVSAQDLAGDTLLIKAAHTGQLAFVHRLLAAKADPNVRNHLGRTALMVAVELMHISMVRTLLHAGADPNLADENGYVPLDFPGLSQRMETLLRESGANSATEVIKSSPAARGPSYAFSAEETRNPWFKMADLAFSTMDWLSNPAADSPAPVELALQLGKELFPGLDMATWSEQIEQLDQRLALRQQLGWLMAVAIEMRDIGENMVNRLAANQGTPLQERIQTEVLSTLRDIRQHLDTTLPDSTRTYLAVPAIYGNGPFQLVSWLEEEGKLVSQGKAVAEIRIKEGIRIKLRAPETGKLHQLVQTDHSWLGESPIGWVDAVPLEDLVNPISEPMEDKTEVTPENAQALPTDYSPIAEPPSDIEPASAKGKTA